LLGWLVEGSMTISKWLKVAVPCVVAAASGLGLNSIGGCTKFDFLPVTDGGGQTGGACSATPGTLPAPDCESATTPLSCPGVDSCPIQEPECGSTSTCLPMDDNSTKTVWDFRMRRLTVITPSALEQPFIQDAVVDDGINLGIPACGEPGTGAFSWLLRIDSVANTFETGGAPPLANPLTDAFTSGSGYCWARTSIAQGAGTIDVEPVTGPLTKAADGTYQTTNQIPLINIPIFVHGMASDVVVLPIRQALVTGISVTDNGNCIGSFNYPALDSMCVDNRSNCSRWHTAGALGGYITLKESDSVNVQDLGKSLCVLLTGGTSLASDGVHCLADASGNIVAKGDFCSTTDSAGGCQDSYWLSATFAASAIKIDDNSTAALCNGGGSMTDGGTDSATPPADGGTDAADAASD
jgi:hypothetical protein